MKWLRRIVPYAVVAICVAIVVFQMLAMTVGWQIGISHRVRHQISGVDTFREEGVFFDGGVRTLSRYERRDHTVGRVWGELEYDRWEVHYPPPEVSVTSPLPPTFTNSDWTILGT